MALSIAALIIFGLLADWLFRQFKLPGLVGVLLLGVLAGPYLSADLLKVSYDFRLIALVVILLRAGLELSKKALARVGVQAALLSFVPGLCEGGAIALLGPHFLPLTHMESAILGFIIAAVSPAVVVPMMISFMERKMGAKKSIPTMILAAASLDDVVAIVIFSVLLGIYTGGAGHIGLKLAGIPVSIGLGIGVGLLVGFLFLKLFDRFNPRATKRTMLLIGSSLLLMQAQELLKGVVPFAALLAVMATGFIILEKRESAAHEISSKLGKVWVFASLLLFTLVGAQVDVSLALKMGGVGLALIACGLLARSVGVWLCLLRSNLTLKERSFVVVSYFPKATVQAAIGAVPLAVMSEFGMNPAPGEVMLAMAVMSIVFTAPLGAFLIKLVGERVLAVDENEEAALTALNESQ
jgi:NhaP-type Na+/H+ or K+/H+ antiporter